MLYDLLPYSSYEREELASVGLTAISEPEARADYQECIGHFLCWAAKKRRCRFDAALVQSYRAIFSEGSFTVERVNAGLKAIRVLACSGSDER